MINDDLLNYILKKPCEEGCEIKIGLLHWNNYFVDIGNGRKYQGQWIHLYKKSVIKDKKFTGFGTIIFQDGSKYQGMTSRGKFEGLGRMTHANGDIYQGQWHDGKANGKGTFIDTCGSIYEGEWKDDLSHGQANE